jgi:hypothetical protein
MLPVFSDNLSSQFFAVFESTHLKYGSNECFATGIIQAAREGIWQTVAQHETITTRRTKKKDQTLALSIKQQVHAFHCALNGITFNENLQVLAVSDPEKVTPEMAAEYRRTFQKSVKTAVPELYEAVLVHHHPNEVREATTSDFSCFPVLKIARGYRLEAIGAEMNFTTKHGIHSSTCGRH